MSWKDKFAGVEDDGNRSVSKTDKLGSIPSTPAKCFHCGCIAEMHDNRTHAFIAAVKPRLSYEEFMRQDEAKPKEVTAPEHYTFGGIDTIDFIRAKVTTEMLEGFYFGNVMKYLVRYRHKDGLRDLQKAKVYLQWLIDLEGGSDK